MGVKKAVKKRIGEILIEEGVLNSKDLQKALEVQQKEGGLIGRILIRMGLITEEDLVFALSKQLAIPFIRLSSYDVNRAALRWLTREMALRHLIFPFEESEYDVSFAVSDPLDLEAMGALEKKVPRRVQLFLATVSDIQQAIELYYREVEAAGGKEGL